MRELRNAVARRIALGELSERPAAPSPPSAGAPPAAGPGQPDVVDSILGLGLSLIEARQRLVEEFERRYIERALAQHDGSVSKAASASGIAKRYFQRIKSRGRKPND